MDNIQDFLNTIAAGQDTKPSDVVVPSSTQNDTSQYLSHGQNTWNYEHRGNNSSNESNQWFPKLLSFDCHSTQNEPRNAVISAFLGSCTLFKLNNVVPLPTIYSVFCYNSNTIFSSIITIILFYQTFCGQIAVIRQSILTAQYHDVLKILPVQT